MRRAPWFLIFLTATACVPFLVHAQSTLQPIINLAGGSCTCPGSAPDWGCVLQTIQTVMNDVVAFASIIITLFIAWAGVAFMMSPINAEGRQKARQRLLNAVLGLLIVLCAWLLIDSIMKVIYNTGANGTGVASLGPWNSILSDTNTADQCIKQVTSSPALPGLTAASNAGGGTPIAAGNLPTAVNSSAPISTAGVGACNGSNVQAAAAQGGVQMSSAEANTIACIAGPESNCGSVNKNYNWDAAKAPPPSTAWGPFQITLKGNSACFNNSACEAAANVNGPLNCQNAFTSAGYSIPGQLLTECQTAAASLSCSAVAANCVSQNGATYSAWTNNADSTAAHQACVANNSGG